MQRLTYLIALLFLSAGTINAQSGGISQDWTAFFQSADASFVEQKMKFRVSASVKVVSEDTSAWAGVWVRVDNKNQEAGFFDNMRDRKIKSAEWQTYTVEGEIDKNSDEIFFGGLVISNGEFYFDDFEFLVQNEQGDFEPAVPENAGFEQSISNNKVPNWQEGIRSDQPLRVKGYSLTASDDPAEGAQSLLITGKGIEEDTTNLIGPVNGFSPQIGTLVTMLNNLSHRVAYIVHALDQQQTDFLLDENANSIGALVMHLAAAEAYYQVYTFEDRGFNDEEKKKWQVALSLGDEARKQFRGKPIEHYLAIYQEVRQKTIDELRKRDDAWLAQTQPGSGVNHHFRWFHVMEHQSSHLGQILMLKKRFPQDDEVAKQPIDTDY